MAKLTVLFLFAFLARERSIHGFWVVIFMLVLKFWNVKILELILFEEVVCRLAEIKCI